MRTSSLLRLVATALTVARALSRPGAPTLLTRVQCVPRLTRATLNGSYAATTPARLALVAAAAAYVAAPVDLVPEAVLPLIGLTDDVLVLRWAVRALVEETDRFLVWEAARQVWQPAAASRTTTTSSTARPAGRVRAAAAGYVLEQVRRRLER